MASIHPKRYVRNMSHLIHLTPLLLAQMHHWLIVDIRPEEERRDPALGFIPGSVHLLVDELDALTRWSQRTPVVLSCLSGRRSKEILTMLPPSSQPMATLDGGLLAWTAQGLPVSGLELERQAPATLPPEDIFAHLRACFIAQMTETTLDQNTNAPEDPMALLEQCFERASCDTPPSTLSQWEHVLDHAAALSRQNGTDLKTIADNLDEFLLMLHMAN